MRSITIGKIIFTGDASLADLEDIFTAMIRKRYVMRTNDTTVAEHVGFDILSEVDE